MYMAGFQLVLRQQIAGKKAGAVNLTSLHWNTNDTTETFNCK